MASMITYAGGLRRIEFGLVPNEPRRIIRLGRMNAKTAAGVLAHVENIIVNKLANRPNDPDDARWLADLDETMLAKLRGVGLADGVGLATTTLGSFLERYAATMTAKEATRTFYGHTRRNLQAYFGADAQLRAVDEAGADAWRAWLVENEKLSAATVARRVIAARTMWRKAVRWKLVRLNPFEGVRGGSQANDARKCFVSTETITKVMEHADREWRVILALARWGGLRTPSETYALRWADIDWEAGTILVSCPKLAHNEAYASRIIPLFPELREPLLTLFAEAPDGAEYVIGSAKRTGCGNLRTTFQKLIRRAKLAEWPRLFHALRASRETELMREYDLATVCRWIGNSPAVAARHYAVSMDLNADFRRATGQAQQKAQQPIAASPCQPSPGENMNCDEPQENRENVECSHAVADSGNKGDWAILDSNQ